MKSCMVLRRGLVASLMFLLLSGIQSVSAQGKLHLLKFDDVTQLRDFFKYTGNGSIIVSGHHNRRETVIIISGLGTGMHSQHHMSLRLMLFD